MPKIYVVEEILRFRKRQQLPDESIANYITFLCEVVTICDCKTTAGDFLCDQIMEETIHHIINEEFLLEIHKLDQTIEVARQME